MFTWLWFADCWRTVTHVVVIEMFSSSFLLQIQEGYNCRVRGADRLEETPGCKQWKHGSGTSGQSILKMDTFSGSRWDLGTSFQMTFQLLQNWSQVHFTFVTFNSPASSRAMKILSYLLESLIFTSNQLLREGSFLFVLFLNPSTFQFWMKKMEERDNWQIPLPTA